MKQARWVIQHRAHQAIGVILGETATQLAAERLVKGEVVVFEDMGGSTVGGTMFWSFPQLDLPRLATVIAEAKGNNQQKDNQ